MEGWPLLALIFIVVAFVVVLIIYVFIYNRMTTWFEGRHASPTILHYRDFHGQLWELDFARVAAPWFIPLNVLSVAAEDMARGYPSEDPVSPSELSFARYDAVSHTLIDLDLYTLFADSARDQFVRQTAAQPLVLLRHCDDASRTTSVSRMRRGPLSAPFILPAVSLITTETPVCITTSAWRFTDTNEPVPHELVAPIETTTGKKERRVICVGDTTLIVLPQEGRVLARTGNAAPRRIVSLLQGAQIHYCTDHRGEHWQLYEGAFHLPAGKWCVRAEASTGDRREVRSSSRVYTVDALY